MLYVLFSVSGQPAEARRGTLSGDAAAARMAWTQPSGGAIVGTATLGGDG
jgi:hypothetical protein